MLRISPIYIDIKHEESRVYIYFTLRILFIYLLPSTFSISLFRVSFYLSSILIEFLHHATFQI